MKNSPGFTLVELIVAIGIFLAVVAIASGIFIRAVRTQQFVNDIMAVNSNASLALEQTMRELRSGFSFEVTDANGVCNSAGGFGDTLTFIRVRGAATTTVVYQWNKTDHNIERIEGTPPAPIQTTVLTATNVKVNQLCFLKSQIDNYNLAPWRISLFLKVGSNNDSSAANIVNLQTTVSARILPSEAQ